MLDRASTFSAHSLRSESITEANNRCIDETAIMRHARLTSLRIMRHARLTSLSIMRSCGRVTNWWNRNHTTSMIL